MLKLRLSPSRAAARAVSNVAPATSAESLTLMAALSKVMAPVFQQRMRRLRTPDAQFLPFVEWLEALRLANRSRVQYDDVVYCFEIEFLQIPGVSDVAALAEYIILAEKNDVVVVVREDSSDGLAGSVIALHPFYHGAPKVEETSP